MAKPMSQNCLIVRKVASRARPRAETATLSSKTANLLLLARNNYPVAPFAGGFEICYTNFTSASFISPTLQCKREGERERDRMKERMKMKIIE